MRYNSVAAVLLMATFSFSTGGPARAADECNIKDLDCWGSGSKCNIKFKNKTGLSTQQCDASSKSRPLAKTIEVEARLGDKKVGRTRTVLAGASVTINLDNRVDAGGFDRIRVRATDAVVESITIGCKNIRKVLEADAGCSVLYDEAFRDQSRPRTVPHLLLRCDNGNVCVGRD